MKGRPPILIQIVLLLLLTLSPSVADEELKFKVRLQPRAEFGDFAAEDGSYDSRLDLFVRRSRLEIYGQPTEGVDYVLVLAGDRLGQLGSANKASVVYAYVTYRLSPAANLHAGILKLPFVRQGWVSSSRLLFVDRSRPTLTLSTALGGYQAPQISVHGQLNDGAISYKLGVADGLQPGNSDARFSGTEVSAAGAPAVIGRVEYSPIGWSEGKEMESHLGTGRHLTIAVNAALQNGIEMEDQSEDRLVWGGDISFHRRSLALQVEYLRLERDGVRNSAPAGWYLQSGYYVPGLKLEPAVRVERYDADLPGGEDVITTYTGGLNWYRQGHNLKFLLNLVHDRYQQNVREVDGAASRTILLLQNQVYF